MEPDSELEARLARLVPARPRPGLREDLLVEVRAALARREEVGWLDRPLPWAAAAALLLALLLAAPLLESARTARLAAVSARPVDALAREVAYLLPPDAGRAMILARLRRAARAALERDPSRRRWVEHVFRLHEGGTNHG